MQNSSELKAHVVESLQQARERATEKGRGIATHLDGEVHRHPWMYIGVAALFSAMLGFIFGRRSR